MCEELRSLRMVSCALLGAEGYHAQFRGMADGARLRDLPTLVQFRADFAIGCRSCNSCRLGRSQETAADEAVHWSPLEETVLGVAWIAAICDEWPLPEAGAAAARG